MHYFAGCVVPGSITFEEAHPYVDKAMGPHQEERVGEDSHGFWDWWVIGGRWTGVWAEYDPARDPRNFEKCYLCDGTGKRPGGREQFGDEWYERCGGCNGCRGSGERLKHPPQWAALEFDMVPVERFLRWPDVFRRPITLIGPDGQALEREPWDGEHFGKRTDEEWEAAVQGFLAPFAHEKLVVVDYHS